MYTLLLPCSGNHTQNSYLKKDVLAGRNPIYMY
jgi:hypothetical protein